MRIKRILQNLLLLFVSLMFTIALIEAGVRLAKTELHPPKLFISQTEGVPYKLRANFHGHTTTGIPLDINSLGVRDNEYQLQPPPNTFRIVVLGDSVTMGQAVRQEDSYPKQLEALFAAEKEKGLRNTTVEVINAGVSGYGTHEEMLFLKETAIMYSPDMIIVGFALNDIGSVPLVLRGKDIKSQAFFKVKEFVKYNLWSYSYMLRTIGSFKYNIAHIGSRRSESITANAINEEDYTPKSAAWNTTYEAVKELKATADANNARLVIAILPELRFFNNTAPQAYKYAGLQKSISGQFKQIGEESRTSGTSGTESRENWAGIEIVDLLSALSSYARQEITVSETDAHPNKKGNELAAKAIKEFLDQKDLIRPGPS